MERIQLESLKKWLNSPRRKPLVVWGARQVGKTYLVKELFAKRFFNDFVYIDLKKTSRLAHIFQQHQMQITILPILKPVMENDLLIKHF